MAVTAKDLWPLVEKMDPEERLRLARMVLASGDVDAALYQQMPMSREEVADDGNDPLAWEGEGWDGVG